MLFRSGLPPNGDGLCGMAGGVWEWTVDDYDALDYAHAPKREPRGVVERSEVEKVRRGGSWADCAAALRVTLGMSLSVRRGGGRIGCSTPTVGARLVLREDGAGGSTDLR